jgi:hypothetical protein
METILLPGKQVRWTLRFYGIRDSAHPGGALRTVSVFEARQSEAKAKARPLQTGLRAPIEAVRLFRTLQLASGTLSGPPDPS